MSKITPAVRRLEAADIPQAAEVHRLAFPRQGHNLEWVKCCFASFPKSQCFVAEVEGKMVGLMICTEKSGFRKEAIIDVEQGCVLPEYQGKGIGTSLLMQALPMIAALISERGDVLTTLYGNTRADNALAVGISKTFGAEVVSRVSGIFPADEIFVVVRDVSKFIQPQK